jgi:7-cyano-7-deazaguanine synthase
MGLVTLVSGGIDSTVMAVLASEDGVRPYPLFIDYGQRSVEREWAACVTLMKAHGIGEPIRMNLSGYGKAIPSGLTADGLRLNEDAFLPGRNLLFLLVASAYAYQLRANAVAIGLLDERTHIFPDQTSTFLRTAEAAVEKALGRFVAIVAPLLSFTKREVLTLARMRGIHGTYSCHAGSEEPCGTCISCQEIATAMGKEG